MLRVFIYSYNLELGGIERSLIGLLQQLKPEQFDVDLFLAKQEGELIEYIPEYIHLLPEEPRYQAFGIPLQKAVSQGYLYESVMRVYAKEYNKLVRSIKRRPGLAVEGFHYHRNIVKKMMPQPNEYDIAISFQVPYYYVLTKVKAKRKIGFIHTDYTRVDIDLPFIKRMFDEIDHIACVSDDVMEKFVKVFPGEKEKTFVFENIISADMIKKAAEAEIDDMVCDDCKCLLSIGRFGKAKNFDSVPEICRIINKMGVKVKWFLIGFGSDEKLIREEIKKTHTEDCVILLGKKENPYPYIKKCDLYVQPSRFEGKAVAVREAQILGKPVVITDFPTAKSQISNGTDGLIVPLSNTGCAKGIVELLNTPLLMNDLAENCLHSDYTNAREIEKLFSLIM